MFGLQPTHWLIIAVVALLFFAPRRLPELIRALGKTIREFRGAVREPDGSPVSKSAESKTTETPK